MLVELTELEVEPAPENLTVLDLSWYEDSVWTLDFPVYTVKESTDWGLFFL